MKEYQKIPKTASSRKKGEFAKWTFIYFYRIILAVVPLILDIIGELHDPKSSEVADAGNLL